MRAAEVLGLALDDVERWQRDPRDIWGIPFQPRALAKQLGGLHDGEISAIVAGPNTGKSALLGMIALSVAQEFADDGHGETVYVFSNEMLEKSYGLRWLVLESGVPHKELRRGLVENLEPIRAAQRRLAHLPIDVKYDPEWSVESMKAYMREQKELHGQTAGLILFDYIQNVGGGDQKRHNIEKLVKELADIARAKSIPVVLAAQLNREAQKGDQPFMFQIADSSAIEKAMDNITLVWRPDMHSAEVDQAAPQDTNFFVAKIRNNGERGLVKMVFHPKTGRFVDLAEDYIGHKEETVVTDQQEPDGDGASSEEGSGSLTTDGEALRPLPGDDYTWGPVPSEDDAVAADGLLPS